ncbi:MAG: MFS transporter [Thermoplasmata archaeon]
MSSDNDDKWPDGAKKAITAQFLGFFMDAYDLMLVTAMLPILAKVFASPTVSALTAYLTVLAGYAVSLLFRPVGSAIFGNFGDKIGRRKTIIYTITGFSVMSALTALIPTYAAIGVWSFIIFTIFRMIQGIFIGGEYAAGHPFAMEFAKKNRRGLVSGIVQSGFTWGVALSGFIVTGFYHLFGPTGMLDVGWRWAFVTGLIPFVIVIFIRYFMPDSPLFEEIKNENKIEKVPFFTIFKPPVLYTFLQVFVLMVGLFFSSWSMFNATTGILTGAGLTAGDAALWYAIGGIFAAISAISWGFASDFIGRRRAFLIGAIITFVLSIPVYYFLYTAAHEKNYLYLVFAVLLEGLLTQWVWGLVPAYLSERFGTQRRASGVGFGYSSGLFVSGWMPIFMMLLVGPFKGIQGTNLWFTAAFFLLLASILYGIGAYIGPETKDIDLRKIN